MVTGSEMSLVLGRPPKWFKKTREELLEEKRSGVPDSFEPTRRMLWGSLCEKTNLRHFCKLTGVRARSTNLLLQSTRCQHIGSTLDGVCRIPSQVSKKFLPYCGNQAHAIEFIAEAETRLGKAGLIEMKQTDYLGQWKYGVPDFYLTQVQTQLYVSDATWCLVVVKVGAADMRAYFVDADPFEHDEMEEAVKQFWSEVRDE